MTQAEFERSIQSLKEIEQELLDCVDARKRKQLVKEASRIITGGNLPPVLASSWVQKLAMASAGYA